MPSEIMRGGVSVPTPKPDNLSLVEESTLATIRQLKEDLRYFEDFLADLRSRRDGSKLFSLLDSVETTDVPVKQFEFKGMRAVEAAEVYLKARRPTKIPFLTLARDVVAGGAFPGDPRGKVTNPLELAVWNIGISLKNTNSRFDFSPKQPFMKKGKPAWKIPDGVSHEQVLVWLSEKADTPRKKPSYYKPRKK